ncbi:MAG: bifunctional DNA-formamidopyrimidine glycosylase/DNA-(apurinic or apyrimidinic site) lyase [Acidobacteriota bacterium]|nr:bifunctional DNA-formamidopyrimidine glycosylase/DNA-(apurinic or apyrimidinic site) lyase [Acidobacteriota bacterium]
MPELPEVETIANGVHQRVVGARITSVWTSGKPQTFKTPPAALEAALSDSTILEVKRVGKTIVMRVRPESAGDAAPLDFLIHLGMTGRLVVATPDVPPPPHTHAVLSLADGREVRFVDPRRFGRLSLAAGTYTGPGAEPTTIGEQEFIALFRGRKLAIKAALLHQSLLHGVGNIYADESLFRAGIRPTRPAGRLTRAELLRLREALRAVLARAIQLGGSSVSDYVDAEGMRGYFQIEHAVYGRGGQPCKTCGTPVKKIVVGGRGTHYCPQCQR